MILILTNLSPKVHVLFVHITTKVELSLKKHVIQEIMFVLDCWLVVWPKAPFSALFASDWSCKIYIYYSWKSVKILVHLCPQLNSFERSIFWDKHLVYFLGDCSKHCLTVTMWFSMLTNLVTMAGHSCLWCYPIHFLSPWICLGGTLLWFLVGVFLPEKYHWICC